MQHGVAPKRARTLIGGLAALALTVTACGGDDDGGGGGGGGGGGAEGELTTVNIGTLPISNAASMYLGMQEGFFEEEGLEIEPTVLQSGNEIITGLVSGDFDFGFVGYISTGIAASQGVPVCAVTAADATGTSTEDDWQVIVAAGDSPINGPADLAGATVGINALGGVAEVMTKAVLDQAGVDPNSVELLEIPFPEVPAALAAGRIDAGYTAEPFVTQVLDQGGKVVVAPGPEIAPEFPNGNYSTTEQAFSADPELVERFVAAMNRSSEYAAENPDAVRAIIPTYTQIPEELAARIRLPVYTAELDEEAIDQQMGFLEQYTDVGEVPSADELICG
jgi:NitT/TauT family transport system substrate-binding protein